MSSQRETAEKGQILTVVGGINERAYLTELAETEWASQLGVFPEWNGLQARLFGKRTLAKYADGIYGIYQFWTPYGYPTGLYQFEDTLDAGPWLTPTSSFDLTVPDLPAGPNGYTLDDFGNPFNNEGWRTGDACVLAFLGQGSIEQMCSGDIDRQGTPDDSNGGPAGQGSACQWVDETADAPISSYMVSKETSPGIPYTNVQITNNVGGTSGGGYTCVPAVGPPVPIGPNQTYGPFAPVATGGLISAQYLSATTIYTPMGVVEPGYAGPCSFSENYTTFGDVTSSSDRCVLNLSQALLYGKVLTEITMLATGPDGPLEIPLPVSVLTEDFELDLSGYRIMGATTYPTLGSAVRVDYIEVSQLRFYYRSRSCA